MIFIHFNQQPIQAVHSQPEIIPLKMKGGRKTFPHSFIGIGQSSSAAMPSVWIACKVKPAAVGEAKRSQIFE